MLIDTHAPICFEKYLYKKDKLLQLTDDDTRKIISPNLDSITVKRFLDLIYQQMKLPAKPSEMHEHYSKFKK